MKNITLKSLLKEEIDYVDYFNNNKFKLSKNFPAWYKKKYGDDARWQNIEKWAGKFAKIYKVKPGDTSIQISWMAKYAGFSDYYPKWSIMIPFNDVFKYKLLDKR